MGHHVRLDPLLVTGEHHHSRRASGPVAYAVKALAAPRERLHLAPRKAGLERSGVKRCCGNLHQSKHIEDENLACDTELE